MQEDDSATIGRPVAQFSRIIGNYQKLLRRLLEHFFPDALLEQIDDRSTILWDGPWDRTLNLEADENGLGVVIDSFRTRFLLQPSSPVPFLPSERRLIETIVHSLDERFHSLFDQKASSRSDIFQYALEDVIVTEYLNPPEPQRLPAALEALRVAALSTYENRRVSSGALLLGTDSDPSAPGRVNPPGAPRYNIRLTSLKSLHRLCDGVRTVFVVDRQGDLAWAVDIMRWADQVQGPAPVSIPCPRAFTGHAKATRSGDHVVMVLTPSQEIKVFAQGTLALAFSDARWRLLDIPTKYASWCRALGDTCPNDLARRIFQAALNLAEDRHGGLFVVLRDPAKSLAQLVAPTDRIAEDVVADDPQDPDNLSPRLAKQALHHLVRDQQLGDLDDSVLESLASIDGAVVTCPEGRLLAFGAILRITPEAIVAARAVEGARTVAALAASFHGPSLKVSEDGLLTMFLGGRRVWEL